jgi:micrococcal nuclease
MDNASMSYPGSTNLIQRLSQIGACAILALLGTSCSSFDDHGYDEAIRGQCIRVIDGDTFILKDGGGDFRVRLTRIDAPDRGQPYFSESKTELARMIMGEQLVVGKEGVDRYQRLLGEVCVGGRNINEVMVEQGMAWHYAMYDKGGDLADVQDVARVAKKGLWSEDDPLEPWLYRRQKRTR